MDKSEFSYYTYEVGRYEPYDFVSKEEKKAFKPYKPETGKLVWNIFIENFNGKRIEVCNLFEYCWPFLEDLIKIKKKYGKDFKKFAEEVRRALMHEYWARSQHETIITSWPPYIDGEELDRLIKEREERISKGMVFYREHVNTEVAYKIDVYTQIMMNWDRFIEYLFNNQRLITKKKLGLE